VAARASRKYALDSNVFIDAFRTEEGAVELEAFHAAFTPFEHLSAVVAMELRASVRGKDAERDGQRWQAFANDVLIAVSCREAGVIVVTSNTRDFERIAAVTNCEFVAPWPAPR
jgi:predicted nucleic acid-binding protein